MIFFLGGDPLCYKWNLKAPSQYFLYKTKVVSVARDLLYISEEIVAQKGLMASLEHTAKSNHRRLGPGSRFPMYKTVLSILCFSNNVGIARYKNIS